jgi:hypothetical protein
MFACAPTPEEKASIDTVHASTKAVQANWHVCYLTLTTMAIFSDYYGRLFPQPNIIILMYPPYCRLDPLSIQNLTLFFQYAMNHPALTQRWLKLVNVGRR